MEKVAIEVNKPYDVLIGSKLLEDADQLLKLFVDNRKVFIVTEENVANNDFLEILTNSLSKLNVDIHLLILPPGEAQKSMQNVELIIEQLANLHFSREDVLIALGGGVIGDLVGFTASIYLRGIDYIQVPTTFLSAIDSSVGGKTAIDIKQGKNMVGAFYHPVCVICDINTFETLPTDIFEDGCSELIKYAMIMNPSLLHQLLEREIPLNRTSKDLVSLVSECVRMKRSIVLEDEYDNGLRQLLNFGHTLGHAIEQLSHYTISHGRAVAIGMYIFTKMALSQQILSEDFSNDFKKLLNEYHLLDTAVTYSAEEIISVMLNDKKRRRNEMTIVLPNEFGHSKLIQLTIETFQDWFAKEWRDYAK